MQHLLGRFFITSRDHFFIPSLARSGNKPTQQGPGMKKLILLRTQTKTAATQSNKLHDNTHKHLSKMCQENPKKYATKSNVPYVMI